MGGNLELIHHHQNFTPSGKVNRAEGAGDAGTDEGNNFIAHFSICVC